MQTLNTHQVAQVSGGVGLGEALVGGGATGWATGALSAAGKGARAGAAAGIKGAVAGAVIGGIGYSAVRAYQSVTS